MSGWALFQRLTASRITGSSFSAANFQNCSVTLPPAPKARSGEPSAATEAPVARLRTMNVRRVSPPFFTCFAMTLSSSLAAGLSAPRPRDIGRACVASARRRSDFAPPSGVVKAFLPGDREPLPGGSAALRALGHRPNRLAADLAGSVRSLGQLL